MIYLIQTAPKVQNEKGVPPSEFLVNGAQIDEFLSYHLNLSEVVLVRGCAPGTLDGGDNTGIMKMV